MPAILLLAIGSLAFQLPSFEVASVKHAAAVTEFNPKLSPTYDTRSGRFSFNNTLLTIFMEGFSLPPGAFSAPDWMKNERYLIRARAVPGTSPADSLLMMRRLLEDRFGLRYHYEDRLMPVYELTRGKPSEPLVPAKPGAVRNYSATIGHFKGTATLDDLAEALGVLLERPTINKSEYDGLYAFNVSWNADIPGYRTNAKTHSLDPAETVTTYLHVAERLGLKLQPAKATAKFLVVDSINRDPTPN